jgi:hypothetical protein
VLAARNKKYLKYSYRDQGKSNDFSLAKGKIMHLFFEE